MKKQTSALLILLLLLPNFAFLVPLGAVVSALASPTGQPLNDGTIVAHNSWDLSQTCPTSNSVSQPLQPVTTWSPRLSIPIGLLRGQPSGSYVTQSFSLSTNGTFSVSDDYGNAFSLRVPMTITGSSLTTSLVANSSMAIQETQVSGSSGVLADIKFAFSTYRQFCYPAGVRLEISGTVKWPTGSGKISIGFGPKPTFPTQQGSKNTTISVPGYRASFGNPSGVGLGFDWSDSKALAPTYSALTNSVDYSVGNTFLIDPITVATTTAAGETKPDFAGQTCYANGRYWFFYNDGTNNGWKSSLDGITWSAERTISTNGAHGYFAFYCKGITVYYATEAMFSASIYYNKGTLNSDGTITWGTEGSFSTTGGTIRGISTTLDTSGHWWVAFGSTVGVEVWQCASPSSCTWSQSTSFTVSGSYVPYAKITNLTSGRLSLVYNSGSNTVSSLTLKTYNGSVWSSAVTTTGTSFGLSQGSCVAIADTTECGFYDSNSMVGYIAAVYNGNSPIWLAETVVASSCSSPYASIGTDGSARLAIAYLCNAGSSVSFVESFNAGATWTAPYLVSSSQTNPQWINRHPRLPPASISSPSGPPAPLLPTT